MKPANQGGSTGHVVAAGDGHDAAAMEPADQRREHPRYLWGLDAELLAAMEPTDQRREHLTASQTAASPSRRRNGARRPAAGAPDEPLDEPAGPPRPQWSPPTSGGSTSWASTASSYIRKVPQWSPPTSGGSTGGAGGVPLDPVLAAMEPADQRREHGPRPLAPSGAQDGAAMEPADQRREHAERRARFRNGHVAAMEPADQRREHPVEMTYASGTEKPQWSPPTSGGSTSRGVESLISSSLPQWSPPTSGGSTC